MSHEVSCSREGFETVELLGGPNLRKRADKAQHNDVATRVPDVLRRACYYEMDVLLCTAGPAIPPRHDARNARVTTCFARVAP
jgi:hypothetical protein